MALQTDITKKIAYFGFDIAVVAVPGLCTSI